VTTTQLARETFANGDGELRESAQCSVTRWSAAITPLGDA